MDKMSAWRAMVRSPPSAAAPESDFPLAPPPQAARATVAAAAIPVNLNRLDRVIDGLIVLSRRSGMEGARAVAGSSRWLGGTAGHPDAGNVAFITSHAKYFFFVTFETIFGACLRAPSSGLFRRLQDRGAARRRGRPGWW